MDSLVKRVKTLNEFISTQWDKARQHAADKPELYERYMKVIDEATMKLEIAYLELKAKGFKDCLYGQCDPNKFCTNCTKEENE